ncbi:transposase [Nocardia brasiliensis]|uniref:transposase n=1 Tax=Nocardia brasiliensis TaxID=37326 RepID=UPI002458C7F5|nr:transposase [Nocardia brasiliensis]
MIRLQVRRLFCGNPDCGRRTFAEQVPGLAERHARRTSLLQRVLRAVALALGGRAGARMTGHLAATVSRMTLLRSIRALPDPDYSTPRILGVDDFALRRGHHYGTIVIAIEIRRPVDVLEDRAVGTLAVWLRIHQGVEIVCGDCAGACADGIAAGAPHALQVADRWHIWHNLGEPVERVVAHHRACLDIVNAAQSQGGSKDTALIDTDVAPVHRPAESPEHRTDKWAVRGRERHTAV